MQLSKKLIGIICLIFSCKTFGQRNCSYIIDTARILHNKNLDSFLSEIKKDSFKISYDKKDIPSFIKKQLDCLAHKFSLANPDERYQATDVITKKLPWRQLQFLALSDSIMILDYLSGGFAEQAHVVFVKFQNDKIIDLWSGRGFYYPKSIKEILDYIEMFKDKENALNSKKISF